MPQKIDQKSHQTSDQTCEQINVEVVYALPHSQTLLTVKLPRSSTVIEAIHLSEILQKHAEINLESNKVGIFGKLSKPDAILQDRDRIEIYRYLLADPKEIRRQRAQQQKL